MRKVLFFFLLMTAFPMWASTDSVKVCTGFSGGMMLHAGYLFGQDQHAPHDADGVLCSPEGATFGLGGALRIHLFRHLRVGGEGFVSTMSRATTDCCRYLQSGSYIRTGWGGLLADACWQGAKVWPFIGGTVGGGAMRALYILEGNEDDWQAESCAIVHRQPFFCIDPYVGLDWCMNKKVHMTFRFDWLIALHHGQFVLPTGPRLYVGFMFGH